MSLLVDFSLVNSSKKFPVLLLLSLKCLKTQRLLLSFVIAIGLSRPFCLSFRSQRPLWGQRDTQVALKLVQHRGRPCPGVNREKMKSKDILFPIANFRRAFRVTSLDGAALRKE